MLLAGFLHAAEGIIPGAGSQEDPFIIEDVTDFGTFAETSSYWDTGVFVKLNTDIDLSGQVFEKAVTAWSTSTGVRFSGTKYNGTFDGNDKTIQNLTIDGSYARFVGLFGYIGDDGTVMNLTLSNFNVTGNRYTGGLCGQSTGFIYNCDVSGQITGGYYTGGLCGYNYYGAVTSGCSADCQVEGVSCVGVLCGSNASATIIQSKAAGYVYASYSYAYVGGVCGANGNTEDSYILNCCSSAEVVSDGDYAGGACGWNYYGMIAGCYSSGTVTGSEYVGGLAGYNEEGIISNSYSLGDIAADYTAGGFCGENTGEIINVYSAAENIDCDDYYVGGLCGYNDYYIEGAFWDISVCNLTDSDGGQGCSTTELQQQAVFAGANWDFTGSSADGTSDIWRMPFNEGYPILAWQKDIAGDISGEYGVDLEDFSTAASCWQTPDKNGDVNNSGYVDLADIMVLAQNWLYGIE